MGFTKYRWDEDRGDQYAEWGRSWWFFETGIDGYITRQIEIYDSGVRLRYSSEHEDDEFGGLGQGRVADFDQPPDEIITAEKFEMEWCTGPWRNA